ncbi:hypothetical protein DN546_31335, partial [Burkholderia multivorans]
MVRINLGSPGLNPLAQSHLTLGLVLTGSALLVACLDPVRRDVENITITVPLHEIPVQVFLGFGTVSGEVILCLFDARGRVRSVRSREDLSRLRTHAFANLSVRVDVTTVPYRCRCIRLKILVVTAVFLLGQGQGLGVVGGGLFLQDLLRTMLDSLPHSHLPPLGRRRPILGVNVVIDALFVECFQRGHITLQHREFTLGVAQTGGQTLKGFRLHTRIIQRLGDSNQLRLIVDLHGRCTLACSRETV